MNSVGFKTTLTIVKMVLEGIYDVHKVFEFHVYLSHKMHFYEVF